MLARVLRSLPELWRVIAASVATLGVLLTGMRGANAALLVYEPFNYDAGTVLDQTAATGHNLTGDYTSTGVTSFELVVQSPGLDYGNLSGARGAEGNRLIQTSGTTVGDATVRLDQDVVINPGEAIFFSTLFTFDDSANGNHRASITFSDEETGDELSFGEPAAGVRNLRVSAHTAATVDLVANGADNSFVNGQTLFFVGRYFNSETANGDLLELIGYDVEDSVVLPTGFDPTDPNAEFTYGLSDLDIDFAKITAITFLIRGTMNNFIDELRIGSTYASVIIPEPGTLPLGAIVAAFFTGLGRRLLRR